MTIDQFWIVLIGVLVAVVSRKEPRASMWLALLIIVYLVTALYWRLGLEIPYLAAALTDCLLAYAIYHFARKEWEIYAGFVVQTMCVANLAFFVMSRYIDVAVVGQWSLEILNYAFFAVVGGTHLLNLVLKHVRGRYSIFGSLRGVRDALGASRKETPFYKRW